MSPTLPKWHRGRHLHPCPETDRIDEVLNELEDRTVVLNKNQIDYCTSIGKQRNSGSKRFYNLRVSTTESDEYINIIGSLGECAVCQYLGIPYKGTINEFRKADLPFNIEVRSSMTSSYMLKIRPDDDDGRRVVMALVPAIGKPIVLPGWILSKDGKRIGQLKDYHNSKQPHYRVDQDDLWLMQDLKKIVKSES